MRSQHPGLEPDEHADFGDVVATVFADAAGALHGNTDVESKLEWTVDAARSLTDASEVALLGWDNGHLVVLAGDSAVEDLVERLASILVAIPQGEATRPVSLPLVDARTATAVAVPGTLGPRGALVLVGLRDPPERALGAMTALAANLGAALENHQKSTHLAELDSARREVVHQLQEAVRPATPDVPGTALGVYYLASDPEEPSGGDLYDWHVLPGGDLYVAVIDIVGKGVAATKDAVAVAHVLRVLVLQGTPLRNVIREADDLLGLHHPDLAATMVVARYTPATGQVEVANGGHPPLLVVRADGTTEYLEANGAPLGFPGAGSRDVATVTLGRADSLIFYTDGVIEARKDIELGLEELATAAASTSQYPARQQARALVERALAGAARRDDSLVLVLRRRVPPDGPAAAPSRFEHTFSPSPAAVGLVRHLLADWLRFQGITGDQAEDPLLVVTELAANAVAACLDAQSPVAARARAEGTALVIEVVSPTASSVTLPKMARDETPDLGAVSGRGLFLVATLSDQIEIVEEEDTLTVRAVFADRFP